MRRYQLDVAQSGDERILPEAPSNRRFSIWHPILPAGNRLQSPKNLPSPIATTPKLARPHSNHPVTRQAPWQSPRNMPRIHCNRLQIDQAPFFMASITPVATGLPKAASSRTAQTETADCNRSETYRESIAISPKLTMKHGRWSLSTPLQWGCFAQQLHDPS